MSKYIGVGGHERVVTNMARGLKTLGHDVFIGLFSATDAPADLETVLINRSAKFDIDRLPVDFDLIHNHQTLMNYYSLTSKRPFIFHFYSTSGSVQAINLKISAHFCRKKISKVLAISKSSAEEFRMITGDSLKGVSLDVIYIGVDTKFYNDSPKMSYVRGTPQLLFVGNLYKHKNVVWLIESMVHVLRVYPRAHLQIVGYGEDYARSKKMVHEKHLDDHVEIVGRISDEELRGRYSSSDIYVSASLLEGFGLPVIEAMASGTPVLLSNIPSHVELVMESKAGQIFSVDNSTSLVTGIKEISENMTSFQQHARDFSEKYDWSAVCNRISNVYDQVLSTS